MFLLRCCFWLAIVFASLFRSGLLAGSSEAQRLPELQTLAREAAQNVIRDGAAKVESACLKAPANCLQGAAMLQQIVAEKRSELDVPTPPNRPNQRVSARTKPALAVDSAAH